MILAQFGHKHEFDNGLKSEVGRESRDMINAGFARKALYKVCYHVLIILRHCGMLMTTGVQAIIFSSAEFVCFRGSGKLKIVQLPMRTANVGD